MTIHLLTAPKTLQSSSLPFLAELIEKDGHVVASDWFSAPEAAKELEKDDISALTQADYIIIEIIEQNLDDGLNLARVLQHKKPVLALIKNTPNTSLIGTIQNQYLTKVFFTTPQEAATAVEQFLTTNSTNATDTRFNFFIDRPIYQFLRDRAYETGKTKSEIIREILDHEIQERER